MKLPNDQVMAQSHHGTVPISNMPSFAPQEIIYQYNLQDLQENGWVYMKIVKSMPGLKRAARLANERLVHHLAPYGYAPFQHTPSLRKHESKRIIFALVVDNFGIKSTSQAAITAL